MVIARSQRIAEREEAFAAFEEKIRQREEDLCEQSEEHRIQEAELVRRLDSVAMTVQQAGEERKAAEDREQRCEAWQREMQKQHVRLQKRLDRVLSTKQQLEEDGHDIAALSGEHDVSAHSLEDLRERAAVVENELYDRQRELEHRENDLAVRRSAVKVRQDQLEPVQSDLQAKEADHNERQALLNRRRLDLEEREACLERARLEIASANERSALAQQSNDEAEHRLTRLWDDIHQRQQVLEDLDTSMEGREQRLSEAEHSLIVRRSQGASPQQEDSLEAS